MIPFLLILFLGFTLRLLLLNSGFHVDLFSIGGWSEWIYQNRFKGFYEENVWIYSWPTQLPITNIVYGFAYHLYERIGYLFVQISQVIAIYRLAPTYFLWFFDFVKWFGGDLFLDSPLRTGLILTIKFLAVLADLGIATIIFFLNRKENIKRAYFLSGLFLFLPFSWYLSAIWGQFDQLGFLLLLISFLTLKKNLVLAPIIFFLSINIKPTGIIFIPLFIWLYLLLKPKLTEIIFAIAFSMGLFLYTTALFTDKNIFAFITNDLSRIVLFKTEFRVTAHAFNFWHVFLGYKAVNQDATLFLLPFKVYGFLIFSLINILAFKLSKVLSTKNIILAMFLVGMGGWLFYMNMLERYAFPGIVLSLCLAFFYPRVLKFAIILSLIFWVNLYESFWFPQNIDFLRQILIWQGGIISRVLSLINIITFAWIFWITWHKPSNMKV